jgi:hypothetical protein
MRNILKMVHLMDSAIEGSKFRGTKLKATQPLGWEALA